MTRQANDSSGRSSDPLALTEGERQFLAALVELEVPFMVVGLSSAALQGARVVTQDIDLWFKDRGDQRIGVAAARLDVVLTLNGLDAFDIEYGRSREIEMDGIVVRALPLERIIASKRAAGTSFSVYRARSQSNKSSTVE